MVSNLIKIKGYIKRVLYPKMSINKSKTTINFGTEDTYAVIVWEIGEVVEGIVVDKEITITGEYPTTLKNGAPYTILAKQVQHPTYGMQYQLLCINEEIDFTNLVNQEAFLKVFLTARQLKHFYALYANPMEVIASHDIDKMIKVYEVGPAIAKAIINRFEEYKDKASIYTELDGYGLTPKFINKLVRRYKTAQEVIDIVKQNPYILIDDIEGVGFLTADRIALQGGIDPKSPLRIQAYIHYFLKQQAEEGNSYITAGELLINIYSFFEGKENIEEVITTDEGEEKTNVAVAINNLLAEEKIAIEDNVNPRLRRIYLTEIYELEQEIAYHLKRLLNAENRFVYSNWEACIKKLEVRQGFTFDDTQRNGIKLGLDQQVCLISGLAGSGKSSLVSGILASLPGYSFAQCALSGKAAARLQEVTGEKGQTIHRLLGGYGGCFVHNEKDPLPYDIIILDEISLVGGEIFLSLLKAIPDGSKLIMLGDLGQLPAIGALNLATDMYYSPVIPTVELKTIHRQAAASGIISTAHEVRNRHQLYEGGYTGTMVLGDLKDMVLDISDERLSTTSRTMGWFKKLYESKLVNKDIMKIQLISPVRERGDASVYALNIAAQ